MFASMLFMFMFIVHAWFMVHFSQRLSFHLECVVLCIVSQDVKVNILFCAKSNWSDTDTTRFTKSNATNSSFQELNSTINSFRNQTRISY